MKSAYISKRVFVEGPVEPACIVVEDGKILNIIRGEDFERFDRDSVSQVIDVGNLVLMPGLVDSHVHVNEPGRSEWEGYVTATKAAAAGGITTIIDMPLNSIPSTTTLVALEKKVLSARDKCYVDVGFWGGIVPGNEDELLQMLIAGVMGFKCFLIHSGVDDFPAVSRKDLESAFQILQGIPAVVLFHAEVDCGCADGKSKDAPEKYATFLETRSEEMEIEAIKMVCDLCLMYSVQCHIVHLSAASALPYITNAKDMGAPLTVETCHHYLSLDAESIPNKATQFKCCPPIRRKVNQNALWDALKNGHIDMVVSDHSPCTPNLKLLEQGDFLKAWGGIASVQFGLSLFWTSAEGRGFTLADTVRLLCQNTAKLANLEHRKGALKIGYDADFVIWDPEASFKVTADSIHHRNKGLIVRTPMASGNQISALPCEETTILNGQEIGGDRNASGTKPYSKLHESRSTVGDGSNFCKRELSKHLKLKKRPEVKEKAIQTFLTGEFIVKSGNIYTGDLVDTTQ